MASYRVEWKPSTKRDLRQITPDQVARIVEAVASLAAEPRPNGSQKLHGVEQTYRIRIGDYRAVYTVSDSLLTVTVLRVRHRRDVYRA